MKQEMMGWQWHQLDHMQNHLHLIPDRQPCQHLITLFFTCWMLFLTPYQQCQSTECNSEHWHWPGKNHPYNLILSWSTN